MTNVSVFNGHNDAGCSLMKYEVYFEHYNPWETSHCVVIVTADTPEQAKEIVKESFEGDDDFMGVGQVRVKEE